MTLQGKIDNHDNENNNDNPLTPTQLLHQIAFDPDPEVRGRAFEEFIEPGTTLHAQGVTRG